MLLMARFGGLGLKTICGGFHGFGPQNPGGGSDAGRMARGGIGEFARSEATGEKARWPSDHIYPESDHIALGDVVRPI